MKKNLLTIKREIDRQIEERVSRGDETWNNTVLSLAAPCSFEDRLISRLDWLSFTAFLHERGVVVYELHLQLFRVYKTYSKWYALSGDAEAAATISFKVVQVYSKGIVEAWAQMTDFWEDFKKEYLD